MRIRFRNFSNFEFPIPGTLPKSSTVRNEPFALRNSTILEAKTGPIPGNLSNSLALARLILIVPLPLEARMEASEELPLL